MTAAAPPFDIVPARDGLDWVKLSIQIFKSHWQKYLYLAVYFYLITAIVAVLTMGLGSVILMPIFSVGFLAAAWHHERGEAIELKQLFFGFKSNWRVLLGLGGIYFLAMLVISVIASNVAGVQPTDIVITDNNLSFGPEFESKIKVAMFVMMMGLLPVIAVLWFSPALVVFSDATLLGSIKISGRAFMKNISAVLVYFAVSVALWAVTRIAVAPILYFIPVLEGPVLSILGLILSTLQMLGNYVAFRRVFHRNECVNSVPSAANN